MSRSSLFARLGRLAAAVAVAVCGALALPATGTAQSVADSCVGAGKVWVVAVTDSGGGLLSYCAGNPSSGLAALNGNYRTESSGLVCQVAGYPAQCPTTYNGQYWSYWTAMPGGSWGYAGLGPGNRKPPAGSIDGWCYTPKGGEAAQQSACRSLLTNRLNPASVVATKPTTKPPTTKPTTKPTTAKPTTQPTTTKPTTKPTSKPTTQPTTRPSATQRPSQSSTAKASPSKAASSSKQSPSASTSSASASTSPSSNPSSGASSSSPVAPTTPVSDSATPAQGPTATVQSQGSPVGVITTVGVLALGGAGAGLYFWKGRKS